MTLSRPLRCAVISDGRRGIENQALGLAEACSDLRPLSITTHHIKHGVAMASATAGLQFALRSQPEHYGLKSPFPEIAIGCGRQAIAPLRALKKALGDAVFTIYVQDPRTDIAYFDLIVAPEHDALSGPNVEPMIGSPNRITRDKIVIDTTRFQDRLNTLPMPRAAFLIGGQSKTHTLSEADLTAHILAAERVLELGHTVMVTTSRRTPDFARQAWQELAASTPKVWLHDAAQDTTEDNPYFAFLGGADTLFVTEDSTNMLTEACTSGKTVFALPMSGKPGKFTALYESLKAQCALDYFKGDLTAKSYPPLRETERIAERVWAHYDARSAVMN